MLLTVLVVDAGARGHALSAAYEKSTLIKRIIVAPGNDFIQYKREKEVILAPCSLQDPTSLLDIAKTYKPDLIDVAQDDALAAGAVDLLTQQGFLAFGPSRQAARIEWDKVWARNLMKKYDLPHPSFVVFDSADKARQYMTSLYSKGGQKSYYLKASGLCGGKGALKVDNWHDAMFAIEKMGSFGDAGKSFLLEDMLSGEEFSAYALCVGNNFVMLPSAQDHKRVFNYDKGPQTGGMGAYAPCSLSQQHYAEIENIFSRLLSALSAEGILYRGILYLGGIVTQGKVSVIEFNARWGDPECHVILPSLTGDYASSIIEALEGRTMPQEHDALFRVCVIGAIKGYPDSFENGKCIHDLEKAHAQHGVLVYGAGIQKEGGLFYANGGRLFSVVGEGITFKEARQRAYAAISHIYIEGNNLHYRTDIGWKEMERLL